MSVLRPRSARPHGRVTLESTGDAHLDPVGGRLDRSGRHGVLPSDRVEDRLRRDTERRELAVADLDEDALRHITDKHNLAHVLDAQQTRAHLLGVALEVRARGTVAGQHVDRRVDVAVLVIEEGAEHALGQLAAAVGEGFLT